MHTIDARHLLKMSTRELWAMLRSNFILVFDDGPLEVTARMTLYSSYVWNYHRKWPNTPLLKKHHIGPILKGKRLSQYAHLRIAESVMFDVWDEYQEQGVHTMDELNQFAYEVVNEMYNDLSYRCEACVTSLDITDFIKVMDFPAIVEAKRNVVPTQQSIDYVHSVIVREMKTAPELVDNPLALVVQSDLANMGQVLQCVGYRAFLTDIDSNLFQNPIMRGYAEGIRLFGDSLVESRSAAKSLTFATAPLEAAEYFNRRLQLMCETLAHLHMTDCGSQEYLIWPRVRPEEQREGHPVRRDDLELLEGKFYLNDDGQYLAVKRHDRHLHGKTLFLRSVLHCAHPDEYGVCARCFGELALSVPENTNLGQLCASHMGQKSTQNVLSVKHYDGSSTVELVYVGENKAYFLAETKHRDGFRLSDRLRGSRVRIIIGKKFAANFTDILDVGDVEDLNITQVSEIPEIGILVDAPEGPQLGVLEVSLNNRLASMTYPLLGHIHKCGWKINEQEDYVVDMEGWDWNQPILKLPNKHFNMSDHSEKIAEILESSMDELEKRAESESVDPTMAQLFDHVNSKLHVNLAVLEVILASAMVVSPEKEDYSLPKTWKFDRGLGVLDKIIANRSMGPKMAYEDQKIAIFDSRSYTEDNRLDAPFDALVTPREVLGDD